jgi:hypothetical protein
MPSRRLFLALASAAAAASFGAVAPAFAAGSLVDVQLVDRQRNQPLPTYQHRGSTWVAGSLAAAMRCG